MLNSRNIKTIKLNKSLNYNKSNFIFVKNLKYR